LIERHAIPRWGRRPAADIKRDDVKALMRSIEAKVTANQVLASVSAIFTWGLREEVGGVVVNPCHGVERNQTRSRERVLADSELPKFWSAFGAAGLAGTVLKTILLTGQRPGEVRHMHRQHLIDGWWCMPGSPVPELKWPGTKNGESHRIWIATPVQALLAELEGEGFVFAGSRDRPIEKFDSAMRSICDELGINDKVTPHDLRRTHGTTITGLGFGRDCMNRVQNHKEGGIASV
jgi:integrase